jgi:hypothetical protein
MHKQHSDELTKKGGCGEFPAAIRAGLAEFLRLGAVSPFVGESRSVDHEAWLD